MDYKAGMVYYKALTLLLPTAALPIHCQKRLKSRKQKICNKPMMFCLLMGQLGCLVLTGAFPLYSIIKCKLNSKLEGKTDIFDFSIASETWDLNMASRGRWYTSGSHFSKQ